LQGSGEFRILDLAQELQLVVPAAIHETYLQPQQQWLLGLTAFFDLIRERQG